MNKNNFELFAIPTSFDVDLASLTLRYRDLQSAVHPDKFASENEQLKQESVRQAARVNDAFETLKNPLLRARYLLELNGHVLNDNETINDPVFLMQQMELRENLESIPSNKSPNDAMDDLLDEIDVIYNGLLKHVGELFAMESPDFIALMTQIQKLQFFKRLKNEAEATLAELENR